jgi:hypothetical protein
MHLIVSIVIPLLLEIAVRKNNIVGSLKPNPSVVIAGAPARVRGLILVVLGRREEPTIPDRTVVSFPVPQNNPARIIPGVGVFTANVADIEPYQMYIWSVEAETSPPPAHQSSARAKPAILVRVSSKRRKLLSNKIDRRLRCAGSSSPETAIKPASVVSRVRVPAMGRFPR